MFGSDLFGHFKPDPETYLGVAKLLDLEPGQVMMGAAHNNDLANARKCELMTAFFPRPNEYGPNQKRDYAAEQEWDMVAKDIEDLATKLGASNSPTRGPRPGMELAGLELSVHALATISVTFVGFSALLLVFRQTVGGTTTRYDSYFLLAFMQVGFIVGGRLAAAAAACAVRPDGDNGVARIERCGGGADRAVRRHRAAPAPCRGWRPVAAHCASCSCCCN